MNKLPPQVCDMHAASYQHDMLMKNSRILMIDDEPINMEILELHLRAEGYSNFVATSDSPAAVELMLQNPPDIVLLDLNMPRISGFDILKSMCSQAELAHIPVVVLTSSDDSQTKLDALSLGANDFLSKPVDASELALRLRNTLVAQAYQHRLTYFDALTGLPNRKYLLDKLSDLSKRSESSSVRAGLLLIGIDRLKTVNDSLGRTRGDLLLYSFSQRLQSSFGIDESAAEHSADFLRNSVVRLSGDTFAVLLPFLREAEDCISLLAPFLKQMDLPIDVECEDVFLSCSVGIVVMPDDGRDKESLLMHAETAMLHAQQRRENSYAFYSPAMDTRARELLAIENGLRSALDNNEFFLTYQPKVCVASGRIVGAEALLRWQHPEYGLVSPEHFIPLAEDSGLIVPIGDFVLNAVCAQTAIWRRGCCPDFKVALNVSVRQLDEAGFTDEVREAIARHQLPADALKIELTENMIMENVEASLRKLQELKAIGVSLSIDDFGTGYSSLGYLQSFPLDELKIDKSFLSCINGPLDKAPVARAVVMLAHDLGMEVVAEGIENHHQLAYIRALRCEHYQGYLCSKPLVVEEFDQLLLRQQNRAA